MKVKYEALLTSQTWNLVPPPPGKSTVGYTWVFRIIENSDGSINKYNVRLVSKGYHQQLGTTYTETFSPVVKHVTVRIVLALALSHQWPIKQIYVNNAFLNGVLEKDVYMTHTSGFESIENKLVCKLKKAIYGLKQPPTARYEQLTNTLLNFGFEQSKCDLSYNWFSVALCLGICR